MRGHRRRRQNGAWPPLRRRHRLTLLAVLTASSLAGGAFPPFSRSLPPSPSGRRPSDTAATSEPPPPHRRAPATTASPSSLLSVPQRLLSGGASRSVAQMILYPIDALRTLAQTRDGRTLSDVGTSALVRGCATTSSFALVIGAIQFGVFGALKDVTLVGPAGAAALGAAGSCLASVPQEVLKQRLVTGVYPSFRSAVSTIYRTEGVKGFYSAWRPTMARNVPFVVVTFTTMDALKRWRMRQHEASGGEANAGAALAGGRTGGDGGDSREMNRELSVRENLLIGISSALAAVAVTHPIDVVKTRMMTQAASKAVPYSSSLDCVKTILRTEGIGTLYAGFKQRSLYMGPLWAIQFALNGKIVNIMEDKERNRGTLATK